MKDLYPLFSHASNCYVCPYCSCGCVPDWEKTHILRCTGCHLGFKKYSEMLSESPHNAPPSPANELSK